MNTIRVDTNKNITTVTINRPDVMNAFNEVMISELKEAFLSIPEDTRAVVLTGEGKAFCAGADIEWMKKSKTYTEEENARDAEEMCAMYRAIDECPKPVIGRINGHAIGGGVGLVACCDMVVAVDGAKFGFAEVRLGIIPAVISTFVIPKIGESAARRYFLTGEVFTTGIAQEIGLVHNLVVASRLDEKVEEILQHIHACGPKALGLAKDLIRRVADLSRDQAIEDTVKTIAALRLTDEAQEGLGAFLDKRMPDWYS